ncbi:hypothetical protein B7494_g2979 [Chlorociboria aeruginascens]|nr:hypothetical protein B7494_g2979 [Chlorociboria aeruginascens]
MIRNDAGKPREKTRQRPLANTSPRTSPIMSTETSEKQQQQQYQQEPENQLQQLQQPGQQNQNSQVGERAAGYRGSAIRESRIKDRPVTKDAGESSLKIKIELDLEVEVDLYARVKGDVTIGLM